MKIASLLRIFAVIFSYIQALSPPLCTHSTDWSLDNRNIMHESRGYILLIAFMPVHCNFCQNQLKKLQVTTQIFREIRVVIIVAMDENPRTINYYQQEFPELTIIKDSTADRVWEKHGATPHDHFIYDRCGRLSIIIRHPRSDMSNYEDTIKSLKSALNYARCGWCQYDPQPSFRSLPQISAYFHSSAFLGENKPRTNDSNMLYGKTNRNSQRQISRNQFDADKLYSERQNEYYMAKQQQRIHQSGDRKIIDGSPRTKVDKQIQVPEIDTLNKWHSSNREESHFSHGSAQSSRREKVQQRTEIELDSQLNRNLQPPPRRNEDNHKWAHIARQGKDDQSRHLVAQPEPSNQHIFTRKENPSSTAYDIQKSSGDQVVSPLYDSKEEYDYSDDYVAKVPETTEISLREQIIATEAAGSWPTPFVFPEVPCAAFTDEVCYQQLKQVGMTALNKCCTKGIYLTDICMAGHCSNSTIQICCAQKFLQARYRCCEDKNQEKADASDSFSRCCYENFVEDRDNCCPSDVAKIHWLSLYDICLPDVRIDLSEVQLTASTSDTKMISVDLNIDRSWDHKCRYGGKALQFPYLPQH